MSDSQPVAAVEGSPSQATAAEASVGVPASTTAISASVVDTSVSMKSSDGNPVERLAQTDKVTASWLWMNKNDQLFVGVFAAVFLALSGYHWATLGRWGLRPIEIERQPDRQYDFRIDINRADWVEWTQIEGIGEATAQKIISDREANGPFRSIDDLLRVKGIGQKKLEMMKPFLREPNDKTAPTKAAP